MPHRGRPGEAYLLEPRPLEQGGVQGFAAAVLGRRIIGFPALANTGTEHPVVLIARRSRTR